jgi:hypothetical protein
MRAMYGSPSAVAGVSTPPREGPPGSLSPSSESERAASETNCVVALFDGSPSCAMRPRTRSPFSAVPSNSHLNHPFRIDFSDGPSRMPQGVQGVDLRPLSYANFNGMQIRLGWPSRGRRAERSEFTANGVIESSPYAAKRQHEAISLRPSPKPNSSHQTCRSCTSVQTQAALIERELDDAPLNGLRSQCIEVILPARTLQKHQHQCSI